MEYIITGALLVLVGCMLGYAAGYYRGTGEVRRLLKILRPPPGSEIESIGYRRKE